MDAQTRNELRRRIDAATRTTLSPARRRFTGLSGRCIDAAGGVPWEALRLAILETRKSLDQGGKVIAD